MTQRLSLLLLLSGCNWISTDAYTDKLDRDGDGADAFVDCDDDDANIIDLRIYFEDRDGDGAGDAGAPVERCALEPASGLVANDDDCDDENAAVHPNADEICNGVDDNCNDEVDDDDPNLVRESGEIWFPDGDGDGFPNIDDIALSIRQCLVPDGYAPAPEIGDCDDNDPSVHPDAAEQCADGVDNDCDGMIDDSGVGGTTYFPDADNDGWPDERIEQNACDDGTDGRIRTIDAPPGDEVDCDPSQPDQYPGAPDPWYDGRDQDCAGNDDFDQDGDGERHPDGGGLDCDDTDPLRSSMFTEVFYDGIDADCGGDDDFDQDADGIPVPTDCNDLSAAQFPGALDAWYDGVDSDCAGNDDFDQDGDGDQHPSGGGDDCDDTDPLRASSFNEVYYDGVDANCDGLSDFDQDGDGFNAIEAGGDDCNDLDASIHPGAVETYYDGIDADCASDDDFDQDGDGHRISTSGGDDCDDTTPAVFPGAPDAWYDGVDADCAGNDDYDQDEDGVPSPADCDDLDSSVRPGAADAWYDGIDQDCAGNDDYDIDGDGYRAIGQPGGTDCNDTDAEIHPDADEVFYDGIDQDCAGDDDFDQDGDGHTALSSPTGTAADCSDTDPNVFPGANDLPDDGIDQDCTGQDSIACYADADDDGVGDLLIPQEGACGPGTVPTGGDCNDLESTIYPGAPEFCDLIDQDCNDIVEGNLLTATLRNGARLALSSGDTIAADVVSRVDICGGIWDLSADLANHDDDFAIEAHPGFARPTLEGGRPLLTGVAGPRATIVLSGFTMTHDGPLTVIDVSSQDPIARGRLTLSDLDITGRSLDSLVEANDIDLAITTVDVTQMEFIDHAVRSRGGSLTMDGVSFFDNMIEAPQGSLVDAARLFADLIDTEFSATTGRGIRFAESTLATADCTFTNNAPVPGSTNVDGGAVWLESTTWSDARSVFSSNTSSGSGGAIYGFDSDVSLDESVFDSNGQSPTMSTLEGGTFWLDGDLTLTGVAITGSVAIENAGAIHHTGGVFDMDGSNIEDTTVISGSSGAVAIYSSGSHTIVRDSNEIRGFDGIGEACIVAGSDRNWIHNVDFSSCDSRCLVAEGDGSFTISQNTFSNCHADGNGGAILADGDGFLDIGMNTFVDNSATGDGGAVYIQGRVDISNTHWRLNGDVSPTGFSTSLFYNDPGPTTLWARNTASGDGGALYVGSGSADLCDVTFEDNMAAGDGGAVYLGAFATTQDENGCEQSVLLARNEAGGRGGGIYTSTTFRFKDLDLIENTADQGGGAYFQLGADSRGRNLFSGNTARVAGGGAYAHASFSSTDFLNTEFIENTAVQGGGVYLDGPGFNELSPPTVFQDTDFVRNTADEGSAVFVAPMSDFFEIPGFFSTTLSDTFNGELTLDGNSAPSAIVRAAQHGNWSLTIETTGTQVLIDDGASCPLPLSGALDCATGADCICP